MKHLFLRLSLVVAAEGDGELGRGGTGAQDERKGRARKENAVHDVGLPMISLVAWPVAAAVGLAVVLSGPDCARIKPCGRVRTQGVNRLGGGSFETTWHSRHVHAMSRLRPDAPFACRRVP